MNSRLPKWVSQGVAGWRELGPYAAAELLLPGGSVMAVLSWLLWLYRRHGKTAARSWLISLQAGALIATAVAGCASTRGLAPQASMKDANSLGTSESFTRTAAGNEAWPALDWWTRFGDSQLNQMMTEGLAGSPTLRVAAARTREALAQSGIANCARYPQVSAQGESTRERFPEHSLVQLQRAYLQLDVAEATLPAAREQIAQLHEAIQLTRNELAALLGQGPDRQALATAQEAYDLALLRYREGVGNYLQVLTTQSQLLSQRSLDADLRARSLDLSINLARALGGGLVEPQS
jgi:outer membrane protein TolC